MIKKPRNGLPNLHTGAWLSALQEQKCPSPQKCLVLGELVPHALIQTINTKIRIPGAQRDNRNSLRSTPVLLIGLRSKYQNLLINSSCYIDIIIDIFMLFQMLSNVQCNASCRGPHPAQKKNQVSLLSPSKYIFHLNFLKLPCWAGHNYSG